MITLWAFHQVSLAIFVGVLLLISLSNLRAWRRLEVYPAPARCPRVSVLVPARNEEANVGPCLHSLLAQRYPAFEVIALDDASTDRTGEVLAALAAEDEGLRVLQGRPLPAGWLGKHWACHQLAQAATGELLLFTDADTRHAPDALGAAVGALLDERADLLTAIPCQETGTLGERLIVPLFPWSIHSFLPLVLAHRWRWPAFSASIGQLMLFRREAYDQIGGHAAVRGDVVDDIALGRRIKTAGRRWRLADAQGQVRCRMYRSFREACDGFTKNLFGAFGGRTGVYVFVWLWLLVVFLEPPVVMLGATLGLPLSESSLVWASVAMALALLLWGVTYARFAFPLYLTSCYPVVVLLGGLIAARSLVLTRRGTTSWKGRTLLL